MVDRGGWARLEPIVDDLLATEPRRIVVVVGPGGSGVEDAIGELAVRLGAAKIPVVRWKGRRLEAEQPWAALADLVGVDPAELDAHSARRALLERLGAGSALVVDDAQWIDVPSATAMVAVAERADEVDLRVVVGRRPWPAGPELATLDLLAADGVVDWAPLDPSELAERAAVRSGRSLSVPELEALHASSQGSVWVADALGSSDEALPTSLLTAVRARAGALEEDPRCVLVARSAVGVSSPEVEAALFDGDLQRLADAVASLGAEGILAPGGQEPLPIVREALEAVLPAAEVAGVVARVDEARRASGLPGVALSGAERALERGSSADAIALADPLRIDPALPRGERELATLVVVSALAARGLGGGVLDPVVAHEATPPVLVTLLDLLAGAPVEVASPEPTAPLSDALVARVAEGLKLSLSGSPDDALRALADAVDLAELGSVPPLPETPHALAALVALAAVDLPRAAQFCQRGVDAGIGGAAGARRLRSLGAWIDVRAGRLRAALDEVERLREEGPVEPRDALVLAAVEVGAARRDGDVARLTEVWGRAKTVLLGARADLLTLAPLGELAAAAVRLGAMEAARPVSEAGERLLATAGSPVLWTVPLRWDALQAYSVAGAVDEARPLAAALADADVSLPHHRVLRDASAVWAALLDDEVDADEVGAAAEALSGIGLGWEASHLVGQAAVRSSDSKVTRALLGRARDLKGTVGAEPERLAADTGLSERELEIGLLVRDGLTHREIGERLFISPKTVEHHVARIRQKLGATSRAEMLAALQQIAAR